MPDLTIWNVSKDVHKLLLESAKVHNRSLNKEIVSILTSEADLTVRGLEFARTFPMQRRIGGGARKRSRIPRRKILLGRTGI